MKNTFGWMQLTTTDTKKSQDFYGKLFEWNFNPKVTSKETYIEIDVGAEAFAGIAKGQTNQSIWIPFVNVKDINASVEKAKSLGAEIVIPITKLEGDYGSFSVFKDPTGAVLGIYMPPAGK